jgi:RND family efflux transporter MFP subunit
MMPTAYISKSTICDRKVSTREIPHLEYVAVWLAATLMLNIPVEAYAADTSTSATPLKVATNQAPASPKEDQVTVPGTIQAFFVTDLYAKSSGYIAQINSDIGDHVKKGHVMALIENPELDAQLNKALSAVKQAEASLEIQQITFSRQKELFEGKAATPQSLDEAKAQVDMATANVQAAKAEAAQLKALVGYNKIMAPYDCVVTRRLVNPGDLVQAATATRTQPLFTCEDIETVRVFADVPESKIDIVRPGLPVVVTLYTADFAVREGKVTRVASAVDPTSRTMRIEIDLRNSDGALVPGKYVQVTLHSTTSSTHATAP